MKYSELDKYFVNIKDCSDSDKHKLFNDIFFRNFEVFEENIISEIYYNSNNYLIGGYSVKLLPKHNLIHLIDFGINSGLKSRIYGKNIISRVLYIGNKIYKKEFKGIVASSFCQITKKSLDEKNAYKLRSAINIGGKIVIECVKFKDDLMHIIYIKNDRGYDEQKIKEIYQEIFPV